MEIVAGLAGYLAKLGLVDGELDQMITMLQSGRREETPDEIADGISMEGAGVVQELSPKEMEVLGWLAKGYRNDTIAGLLSRDVKAVERHINNIYSKLQNNTPDNPDATMHPRVRAALMYLKAVGLLSGTEDGDE